MTMVEITASTHWFRHYTVGDVALSCSGLSHNTNERGPFWIRNILDTGASSETDRRASASILYCKAFHSQKQCGHTNRQSFKIAQKRNPQGVANIRSMLSQSPGIAISLQLAISSRRYEPH